MSNTPAVFCFNSHDVRTISKNGEPYFVAADVAEVLGYSNTRDAISRHCKASIAGVAFHDGRQNREMTIIPERDVYRLVMRSKLPAAEKFEEWIVSEVLPAIRKTGSYNQEPQNYTIPTARYIELLEAENGFLRSNKKTPAKKLTAISARKRLHDETGVNKMLYEKYLELHGNMKLAQWWRSTNIPLTFETVSSALLRNHSKSASTIGVIARALKFSAHDIRMMLLKIRGGEAAVLLT